MKRNKYDVDTVKHFASSSISISQLLNKLNIKASGGNYQSIKKFIKKYNIDISHFKGKSWSRGNYIGYKRDISKYLTYGSTITTYRLKNRLIKEKIFEYKCYGCNLSVWCGQRIPLELHHIDGDNLNNNLSNLTILCPNCHALTNNYRGKNSKTISKLK